MLKVLRRFADARSVEGKIVSVFLVVTLAFMAWDVNALRIALADEDAATAIQASGRQAVSADESTTQEAVDDELILQDEADKAQQEAAEQAKIEEEKAAEEEAEREAQEAAAQEAAEREAAAKEAEEQAAREAAEQAEAEKAQKEAAEKEAREAAEKEAAEKKAREAAQKEAAEREAAEQETKEQAERESAQQKAETPAPNDSAPKEEPARPVEPEPESTTGNVSADTSDSEPAADSAPAPDPSEEPEPAAAPADENLDNEAAATETTDSADAYPAVVLYGKAHGITVKLSAPAGALPEGVQIRVKDAASEDLAQQVQEAAAQEFADYRAIDITLVDKSNREVQPRKPVNVTFVGSNLEGRDVHVFHVDGDAIREVDTLQADPNTQSFDARGFSIYFIAATPVVEDMGERFTVTFAAENDNGVETVVSQSFDKEAGSTVGTLPEDPFQAGRHFTGWFDEQTGEQVTPDTVVERDITAIAQFEDVKVFQVTVEHWYTNPSSGEDLVFNRTTVEMERADAPKVIESPVSTTVEVEGDTTNPTYIPTQPSVTVTLDDLATAEVVDGKGYLLKRVEYVPYDASYYVVYKLQDLDGKGYTEVSRAEQKGIMGSSVTPAAIEVEGGVFEKAETATLTHEGQEVSVYFTRAQCRLTFDVNGGTYVDAQTVPYGMQVKLPTAQRTGYTFAGWYADRDLTQRVEESITIKAPTTLYAKWKAAKVAYTVVYLTEKYDNAAQQASYVYHSTTQASATAGSTVTAADVPKLSGLNGYELDGARNADSSLEVEPDGSSILRVYYKLTRYTLVFNINRSNGRIDMGGSAYSGSSYTIENVVLGQDISAWWPSSSNEVYDTKGQAYFAGWTGAGATYITKRYELIYENVKNAKNNVMTFTGTWKSTSYNSTAEYWMQQPDGTYKVEGAYTQRGLNTNNLGAKDIDGYATRNSTPAGYEGSGYAYTPDAKGSYINLNGTWYSVGTNSRYSSYQHYSRQLYYRFYYDRNSYGIDYYLGGRKVASKAGIPFGSDISGQEYDFTPEEPAEIEGCTWGGWYADSGLNTVYDFTTMPGSNLALYANWVMPERSITFVDDESGVEPQTIAYSYGEKAKFVQPEAREGSTFQGWYANEACTALYDFDKPLTDDVTVYANWARDILSYTVRYVDANNPDIEVLPAKTVSSPALVLGQSITEKAAVVAGMLPDKGSDSIELALTGNEITFSYVKKRASITYDVRYVLADDENVEVAPAKTGVTVSGDIVSVKEAAAAVDASLLAAAGLDGGAYYPEQEVIEHTFSLGDNTIIFKYHPYRSTSFQVNYLDMDGNALPGVAPLTRSVKVGGGFSVPTGIAGYTLNHVDKDGVDQGRRVYYVAQSGEVATLNVYYQVNLTVTANNKSKVFDGTALESEGVGDVTVAGLMPGHTLASVSFKGSQTQVGSSLVTPKDARIGGAAHAEYYRISYVSGNLTVTKPQVTVTIAGESVEAVYDGKQHAAGYTIEHISNPDFKAEYIQFNGEAETVSRTHAGTTALALQDLFGVVASQQDNFDVEFIVSDGSVTITPAPLTVTSGSAKRAYDGTPLTAPQCTVEGLVDGETLPVRAVGARTYAGKSENDVAYDWGSATAQQGDYEIDEHLGTLQVQKAALVVTALPQTYAYNGSAQGESGSTYADPTQIGGKVLVEGLADGDSLVGITLAGMATKVGTHEGALVPSNAQLMLGNSGADADDNYDIEYAPGAITITRNETELTLTAEDGGGEYTGTAYGLRDVKASLSDATLEYKVGDGEWSAEAPSVADVSASLKGNISVRATLEGYALAQVDGLSIVVAPRPVSVAAANDGKVYGTSDPNEFAVAVTGLLDDVDDLNIMVSRETGEDAGAYAITPAGPGTAGNGNYAVAYIPGTFTITRAPLVVRAQDAGKVYGAEDPQLEATVLGLLEDDASDAINYTITRDAGEDAGSYAIRVSGATVQGNYDVVYEGARFQVTPASVRISAKPAAKVYGDADPTFAVQVEGLQNGDAATVLSYGFQRDEGEDAGTYELRAIGAAVQGNYTVAYLPATFSIEPALAVVAAEPASKVYGDADPEEFGATVTGLKRTDIDELITYGISRERGEDAGEYAITPTGEEIQGNYRVQYRQGAFTIQPAQATVRADNQTKVYGDSDPELTASVSGLVGSDTLDYTITREPGEDAGSYE